MFPALWCKSHFSFLEGASAPDELVARAVELQLPALALTDRNGVQGIPSAWVAAKDQPLKLITGSQVTIDDGTSIVLLAADREGYANLCRLITAGGCARPRASARVRWHEVGDHAPGLLALWGGARERCSPPSPTRAAQPPCCATRSATGSTPWPPATGRGRRAPPNAACASAPRATTCRSPPPSRCSTTSAPAAPCRTC